MMQIACGYGVSPWVASTLSGYTPLGPGLGPLVSQLSLIGVSGFLIDRTLARNGTSSTRMLQYYTSITSILQAVALAGACVAATWLLQALVMNSGTAEASRSIAEVRSVADLGHPLPLVGVSIASALLAPYVEERIYRGVILQGLLPYTGPAVSVSALATQ
jgi:membrane protease YdiL (CAAX protease family)